jgi:glyoxylase-like metal-dependent hydrolase (beta-lactamase superfamily II)
MIQYLVPTHYHFDHFGGGWSLWNQLKEYNPEVKILTTSATKKQLQNPELHMKRAYRTFGQSIGIMRAIPDEAFEIVRPNDEVSLLGFTDSQSFSLVPSAGHSDDHVCPTFFNNQKTEFLFAGEAAGTRMHSENLHTLGTSMPPEFSYQTYIESLERLISLNPLNIGLGHFGVVKGLENTLNLLRDNLIFTHRFRSFVKDKYEEKNETRWIVKQFMEHELKDRVNTSKIDMQFLTRIIVALVYGQLIDLGFRDAR